MIRVLFRFATAVALMLLSSAASAAITCSVSSPGVQLAYPANSAPVMTQTSFTVTCARLLPTDPTTINYSITVNNGLNPNGINNRAFSGTNSIRYDVFRDSTCATTWKGTQSIADSITTLSGFTPVSKTTSYWGCITTAQAPAAGTYTDTVTMTLSYGILTAINTFPVSISTPATCNVTTPPGNLAFGTYVAMGPAVNASANFAVTCTTYLPYTMSLDAPAGVIAGLQYQVALSSTSATGTGAVQTHTINGTVPAGQAGSCAGATCSGTQTRTLMITY